MILTTLSLSLDDPFTFSFTICYQNHFMPSCCSDLGCTSNYHPFHLIITFRMLDKLPLKQASQTALRYENIDHLKVFTVCIKHFRDEVVELCISYQMERVHSLRYILENLSSKMTVPCLLPGCPSYYSSTSAIN